MAFVLSWTLYYFIQTASFKKDAWFIYLFATLTGLISLTLSMGSPNIENISINIIDLIAKMGWFFTIFYRYLVDK